MSLIHDALKRAGEAGQGRRPALPSPLSPVTPGRSGGGGGAIKWVGLMVVLCFVVAGWYLWRDGRAGVGEEQAEPQLAATEQPSVTAPVVPGAAGVEPEASAALVLPEAVSGGLSDVGVTTIPAVAEEKLTLPSEIRVSTNLITRVATGEESGGGDGEAGVVTGSVALPELRLQSIIFRSEAPMAMINGKTVVAGEKVLGVEVLEIRRGSVLLRWQGSTQEMRLPDL